MRMAKKYDRNHAKKLIRISNKCFLCGTIVVRHKTIKKYRNVIKFSHDKITWVSGDGLIHEHPVATIDHVIPVSKGGVNHIRNKTILCGTCNNKKSNLTPIKKPKQFYCRCGKEKSIFHKRCKSCYGFRQANLIYNSGLRYLC